MRKELERLVGCLGGVSIHMTDMGRMRWIVNFHEVEMPRGLYPFSLEARDDKELAQVMKRLSKTGQAELFARRQRASVLLGRIERLPGQLRKRLEIDDPLSLTPAEIDQDVVAAETVVGEAVQLAIAHDVRRALADAHLRITEHGLGVIYRAALAEASRDGITPDTYRRLREPWDYLG